MIQDKENGFTLIAILLVILIIAAIGYGGFSLSKNKKNNESIQQNVNRQLEKIQKNNNKLNELKTGAINNEDVEATSTD